MIEFRGITHERTQDAPFVGALICAPYCHIGCKGCFNQHLKDAPLIKLKAKDVIKEVMSNPLNEGIILAGLEWSYSLPQAIELILEAQKSGLKTIIYTGLEYPVFMDKLREAFKFNENKFINMVCGLFIKAGPYDSSKKLDQPRRILGIQLATSNQKVYIGYEEIK